jgi:hypothetical protein
MRELLGCLGLIMLGLFAVVLTFWGGIIWTVAAAIKWVLN